MKNKNKLLLFAVTFLFLSVFFVRVDRTINVAKADCYDTCANEFDPQGCYDECSAPDSIDQSSQPTVSGLGTDSNGWTQADCTGDYEWVNNECVQKTATDCSQYGTNYTVDSSGNCVSGANVTGAACADNQYKGRDGKCYDSQNVGDTTNNDGNTGLSDPEVAAALKNDSNEAHSEASSAAATQRKAAQDVDTAYKAQQASCSIGNQAKCDAATAALNKSKAAYDAATADAQSKISAANEAAINAGMGNATTGAGFSMCANGVINTECRDINGNQVYGTPITTGLSGGINPITGFPTNNTTPSGTVPGINGLTSAKCGANFVDVGGICFPTNTGLSAAPISSILANIFSWLMGLFTTLAVAAFVVSGIQYFMAAGNESMMETAKNNATYAILGIIVGLSGFIIIKAVAAALSGQGYFF